MCGIIGIIGRCARGGSGSPDVPSMLYLGMTALQHRGQDACGMCVAGERDGECGWMDVKKDLGLVNDVFSRKAIGVMSSAGANMGIGHVRYTTAGSNDNKSAQPFMAKMPLNISMAVNGNTINHQEILDYLWEHNISVDSASDTEALLALFRLELKKVMKSRNMADADEVFSAAKTFMGMVHGSYSALVMIDGVGLLAMRDPHAIRPLVIGRSRSSQGCDIEGGECLDCYMFASESVAFDVLDLEVMRDVHGGEAVLVSKDLSVASKMIASVTKRAHCMFEYVYFARPDSRIDFSSVYEVRLALGRELASVWAGYPVDVVIAAPDTSRTAAVAFAEAIGVKYREGLIKNRYIGRTFIMPTQEMRNGAVRVKLNPIASEVSGKRVAIVDDSIVRGTTARKTVELLRNAGALEVHFLSTCPPIVNPCVYGIDMPTYDELAANGKSDVSEIKDELGVDSLTYQPLEGLMKAIGIDHLCTACLDGKYPIELDRERLIAMGERRRIEKSLPGDCERV